MKTITRDLLFSALLMFPLGGVVSSPPQERQSVPPLASANKGDEYVSEQGRFRVHFPGKPKHEVSSVGVHFFSYSGLLEYRVSYLDDSDITEDPNSAKRYLKESRDATLVIAKAANERIIHEKELIVDGHPAYFLHVQTDKGWIRTLEMVVGQRVYNVIVECRKAKTNDVEAGGDFEKAAMDFINSFKPIPRSDKP